MSHPTRGSPAGNPQYRGAHHRGRSVGGSSTAHTMTQKSLRHTHHTQQFQNVAVTSRTIQVPRDGPFGGTSIRSSTGCASSRNSASRSFAMQFLWRTVHERGFARWCEVHYSTPAVMDHQRGGLGLRCSVLVPMVCETFLCLLFLIPCYRRFRMHFVFGQEVVREATSRKYQPSPPFSGCVVLFVHGQ